jgi:hypothetical protein
VSAAATSAALSCRPRGSGPGQVGPVAGAELCHAQADRDRAGFGERGGGDGFPDLFRQVQRFFRLGFRGQDQEFFAADAAKKIDFADFFLDLRGHGFQDPVADLLPVRLVEGLEMVDVQHDHGQRAAVSFHAPDLPFQDAPERDPVHDARQGVDAGVILEPVADGRADDGDAAQQQERVEQNDHGRVQPGDGVQEIAQLQPGPGSGQGEKQSSQQPIGLALHE